MWSDVTKDFVVCTQKLYTNILEFYFTTKIWILKLKNFRLQPNSQKINAFIKKKKERIYQQTGSKTVQLKHTQRCLKLAKKY